MKKVGILTFHYSNHNFGAVLQAYALFNLLKELGHEPYIIDYQPKNKGSKALLFESIRSILGYRFKKFRTEKFGSSIHKIKSEQDLQNLNNFIDIFTVGSDQVWRYRSDLKSLKHYYLDFVEDGKSKVAIGASFGVDHWEGPTDSIEPIKELVHRFNAISVREESGVTICRNLFEVEATQILDPTLLVNRTVYDGISENNTLSNKGRFLSYMLLDSNSRSEVFFKNICEKRALEFITVKGTPIVKSKELWLFNSIPTWLGLIKRSDVVITDSFHCVVFCLIFKRNFICVINKERGAARLESLLKSIGLLDRFKTNLDSDEIDGIIDQDINYDAVWASLSVQKESSLAFLINYLK